MSLLTVDQLSHGFGDRIIFENISFRLNRGEHIGLVGANGEGKSTFMNIVTDHLEPDEGQGEYIFSIKKFAQITNLLLIICRIQIIILCFILQFSCN